MKKTLPTASATMAPNSTQSMRLIISRYRLIKVGCPRRTCVLDTLAENLRKNLARDLSSRVAAVFRVFDQYGDRDLWLVVWCEPDKPRAIQALRLAVHGLVVFRGTRFARHRQSLHRCRVCRAAVLHRAEHRMAHEFDLLGFRGQMGANIRLALMHNLAIGGLNAFHDIRPQTRAAIGERCRHARH